MCANVFFGTGILRKFCHTSDVSMPLCLLQVESRASSALSRGACGPVYGDTIGTDAVVRQAQGKTT